MRGSARLRIAQPPPPRSPEQHGRTSHHHARLPAQRLRVRGDARARRRRRARRRVIVNTCAVTARGRAPGAQTIRRLRRENPDARIIVTGCAAQIEPERFAACPRSITSSAMPRRCRPRRSAGFRPPAAERVQVNDIMTVRETAGTSDRRLRHRARAPTCRCRTAAITAARSASSRSAAGRRARCRRARWWRRCAAWSKPATREVVLTGVDITSYGADLPGDMTLGKLVRADPEARAGAASACACPPSTRSRPTRT